LPEINPNNINGTTNFMLRKTKSFNKSRYSRNRQYYRTGVFICLWANIILVMGAYYLYFRLTFKFSYVFILMFSFTSLFLVSFFSRNYFIGFSKLLIKSFNFISYLLVYYIRLTYLKLCSIKLYSYALNIYRHITLKVLS